MTFQHVVALAGGVGGARFADGLARIFPPEALTVIVNTGDDFRRYGLAISPDLDTVMYTLAGLANPVNGWGLEGDTQQMLSMIRRYGDDAWFGLSDKDIATHLLRTQWLSEGQTLTQVTLRLSSALGIGPAILPMSDAPAPTMVDTVEHGVLPFQEYFVRYRWQPTARNVMGATAVQGTDPVRSALEKADLIIICPSNPILSIWPILSVEGYQSLIEKRKCPCIVICPLIGDKAVKGPAAKLMFEMGLEVSAQGVVDYYKSCGQIIDGIAVDTQDSVTGVRSLQTDIMMHNVDDRARLAKEVVAWVKGWML